MRRNEEREREKKCMCMIERFFFQQKCSFFTKRARKRERNSHISLTPLFFLLALFYTYLHFYTIKEVCARANERTSGRERESEYPISYIHIALCVYANANV